MKKILVGAGSLVILALLVWVVFLRNPSTAGNSQFKIESAMVEVGDVARIVSASGSVRALTTVEVGSQVSGQILELTADFNSAVTKGQIIARIDAQTFESRVASAKAEVESAKANIAVQKAQITRAKANLEKFEKDYTRQSALYKEDAISLSLLEDTERQLAVAQSELAVTKAQLRTGQAALTQRIASLQTQNVDLQRTIIRSPITGVVIERNVDVGQTVAASLSAPVLFRIAQDLSDIRIDVAVVESDIGGIDAGDQVSFKVDAYPDDDFSGTVEQVRLASQEIQNVVTYTIVVSAINRGGKLLPGMTANVEIVTENRKNVLRIAEAVSRFRPPADGPVVVDNKDSGQARSGGNGRRGNFVRQMLKDLNISVERSTEIEGLITKEITEVRQSMGDMAQFRRSQMRELINARINRVLKKQLSTDEFKRYKKNQQARSTVRRITVYKENPDGTLQTGSLVIGLSDGSFTEIVRGAKEGDEFVIRLLKTNTDSK
ncbi:MAG: efflux RND transporter periplasmic adaptor subunit [Robiginitomaculum sp.]|nr:efflux RND transporter periplasmic adaptor subunit [Robiginitomaculum sp.]